MKTLATNKTAMAGMPAPVVIQESLRNGRGQNHEITVVAKVGPHTLKAEVDYDSSYPSMQSSAKASVLDREARKFNIVTTLAYKELQSYQPLPHAPSVYKDPSDDDLRADATKLLRIAYLILEA
jgi:hypothetical protein